MSNLVTLGASAFQISHEKTDQQINAAEKTISPTAFDTDIRVKTFHNKSWKSIYFGVKRSKIKVTRQKNIARVDNDAHVSADFL